MAIVVKLEALMLQHGISLDKIAAATGITNVNVSRLKTGKVVAYRGTTIDALIKALRALGVEGCDVADVLGFVPDDEIASIGEGVYISVPKNLHHMSNPYSDAARAKLRGDGGPKTQCKASSSGLAN